MGIWAAHPSSSSVMASVVRAAGSTGRLSASSAYTLRARPRALKASACCSSSVQRPLHAASRFQLGKTYMSGGSAMQRRVCLA